MLSGVRKCQHNVMRHGLKDGAGAPHSGSGRQPGKQEIPGKNTGCPAKIKFSLSVGVGERSHTSSKHKLLLKKQLIMTYPLEVSVDFTHNHSINSADAATRW